MYYILREYIQYVWILIAIAGVASIIVLCNRFKQIILHLKRIIDVIYSCEGFLYDMHDKLRNVDNNMYSICQKNGIRKQN